MNIEAKLKVTDIQRFCMHDGHGIRTTVFLKGCPLRCEWCHNPETQKRAAELLFYPKKCIYCGACEAACPMGIHRVCDGHNIDRRSCALCGRCAQSCPTAALELCGNDMSVKDIVSEIERDREFYRENGGVTVSGGEPFAQGEAVIELLRACHEKGINTAVETCGYADVEILRAAAPFVDTFLWDVKDTDSRRHERYTGVSNELILNNLSEIAQMNARIRMRCILVNGVNTDKPHYDAIAELCKGIHNFDGAELIACHAYSGTKATFIGKEDNGRRDWIPTADQLESARAILTANGIYVL